MKSAEPKPVPWGLDYCERCGCTLPLDGGCDCAGTEVDMTAPNNLLEKNQVIMKYGRPKRTYLPDRVTVHTESGTPRQIVEAWDRLAREDEEPS